MSFSHSNWFLSAGGFIAENVRKMLNPPVGHVRAKRCIHALPAQKQSHTCAHRGRTDINIAKMLAKMPIDWQKYFNANRLAKIAKILAKATSRTSGDRRSESQNFGNVKVHKYTCTCCRHIFLNFKATGGIPYSLCVRQSTGHSFGVEIFPSKPQPIFWQQVHNYCQNFSISDESILPPPYKF